MIGTALNSKLVNPPPPAMKPPPLPEPAMNFNVSPSTPPPAGSPMSVLTYDADLYDHDLPKYTLPEDKDMSGSYYTMATGAGLTAAAAAAAKTKSKSRSESIMERLGTTIKNKPIYIVIILGLLILAITLTYQLLWKKASTLSKTLVITTVGGLCIASIVIWLMLRNAKK